MEDEVKGTVNALLGLFKALRLRRKTSLEASADTAGIHRTHLGLLERGERQPTLSVAVQLAKSFGFELSELLAKAELVESGHLTEIEALQEVKAREPEKLHLRNSKQLLDSTGLEASAILGAIRSTYVTLDTIDAELVRSGALRVAELVELANLSSMVGNLLGAGLAASSEGLYERNKPHTYPDLLPKREPARHLELKMALETNRPKGHLAKAGFYITFRYVLAGPKGAFTRGKKARGNTVWIWEVKVGHLTVEDFDISNTEGDSGKTAVIKTASFKKLAVVYFDPKFCPHPLSKEGTYPAHN